jgi:hypothetical protein
VLYRNFKYGDPALHSVNTLLLATFAAQSLFFFFCFGSLYSDLAVFLGILGLGAALNGGEAGAPQAEPAAARMEAGPLQRRVYPGRPSWAIMTHD